MGERFVHLVKFKKLNVYYTMKMERPVKRKYFEHILIFGINGLILVIGIIIPWALMFAAPLLWVILGAILYFIYRHEE